MSQTDLIDRGAVARVTAVGAARREQVNAALAASQQEAAWTR